METHYEKTYLSYVFQDFSSPNDDISEDSNKFYYRRSMNFKQVAWRCEKSILKTSSLKFEYHKIATWISIVSVQMLERMFFSSSTDFFGKRYLYLANRFTVSHFVIKLLIYSWIIFAKTVSTAHLYFHWICLVKNCVSQFVQFIEILTR